MIAPVLAALLTLGTALAGPAEGDLRFARLELGRTGLAWSWDPASAQVLAARGLTPTLVIRESGRLLWSAPLAGASGTVPLPRRPGPQATVEVVGFDGDWEVRSVAGARGFKDRGQRGAAARPELCAGFVDDDEQCMAALTRIPGDPVQVVQACDRAFGTDVYELRCVEALDRPVADPVQLVKACEAAFLSDDRAVECIGTARSGLLVEACDDAFMADTAELECARVAPGPASVEACDDAFMAEASELACLGLLAESLGDRPDIVRTCADAATTDSDELECIRTVGAGRRR
jgi:hypothetical protein